jgi:hypothetical protein
MAILRSHEIDKLVFEASTETGEVSLVSGKMFVGGEYVTELYVNGALDSHIDDNGTPDKDTDDKPAPTCLVSVYIYNDATPIRLTQCYPSTEGHNTLTFNQRQLINAFRAYGISRIDSVEAEIFVSSVAQVPYENEDGELLVKEVANVFAKGKTKIHWSPAIGFEKGEPVDTRGDVGPSGVWVGSEPPPEGSEYLVWVEPKEDDDPYIDFQHYALDITPGERRSITNLVPHVEPQLISQEEATNNNVFVEFLVKRNALVRVRGKVSFNLELAEDQEQTPVEGVTHGGEVWIEWVHASAMYRKEEGFRYSKTEHHPIRVIMDQAGEWTFDCELPLQAIATASEIDDMVSTIESLESPSLLAPYEWTRYRVTAVASALETKVSLTDVVIDITPYGEIINVNK